MELKVKLSTGGRDRDHYCLSLAKRACLKYTLRSLSYLRFLKFEVKGAISQGAMMAFLLQIRGYYK